MKQFSPNAHTENSNFKKQFLRISSLFFFITNICIQVNAGDSTIVANKHVRGLWTNPTVSINQAVLQNDPTFLTPINFTVVFDQPVGGFTSGDVVVTGTASFAVATIITGGPILYNVSISGMRSCGTITVNIPAGVCTNALSEPNLASTSLDNTVTLLAVNPNVTINQAASQPDPTNTAPINFTVQFDQLVNGFATGDVSLSGTAGATTAIVTGSGDRYNVAVSGMTAGGTVIASIAAGVCNSYCFIPNNASTSTDNTVTINCVPPVVNVTPALSCGGVAGLGCNGPLTASGNADTYIWSPLAGLYINCTGTAPYTGDSRTVVYPSPTVNTIYTVKGTILTTGCSATATAQVNYTPPAPLITPSSVNMCISDPPVKLKVFPGSIPASPAIWSPAAGLFFDATAAIPYTAGTAIDSIWVRPAPAGVYTYQVTSQALPVLLCSPATNFVGNNGDGMITFNLRNNHPFPIRLLQINSKTITAAQTSVSVYYKTSAINGPPGFISAANGWNQFGAAGIAGTGTGIQPFITNLQLTIPAAATYGICLRATTGASVPNLAISTLSAGNYSFNDGGCELITGTNIGYSGNTNTPATPLSGFVGSLQFADATTNCTSPPRTVVVTLGQPATITSQPANQAFCNAGGTAAFSVAVNGAGLGFQWQLSINAGATWNNLVNASPYTGVTTPTLIVNPVTIGMDGYLYRLSISSCSGSILSNAASISFNPIPTVTLSASPLIIGPAQTSTISSTVTPNPATTYTWYYNNSVLTGATSANLIVSYGSPGDYQLKVTDANNCGVGVSNIVTIANSFAPGMLAYPNPSGGVFQVIYNRDPNGTNNNTLQRSLIVYNNWGGKIITKIFPQTTSYQKIDVDVRTYGKGIYWVELRDANGTRLGMSRVVVQ